MSERWESALAVPARSELEARLKSKAEGSGQIEGIAEAALLMAGLDRPGKAFGQYLDHLERLAAEVAEAARALDAGKDLSRRVEALRGVFAERHRYRGDEESYDDPANANMMSVIERRQGLPVALGLLTIQAARAQGWRASGLNFPGHFLVGMDLRGQRALLDPFGGWRTLGASDMRQLLKAIAGLEAELSPQHYAAVDDRQILLRLQNNVRLRALQAGRFGEALRSLEIMLLIAPKAPELWRETGLVQAELGELRAAIAALERFIELAPGDPRADEAVQRIRSLRKSLN
jgi:regulator of sirC expression with transglutaminase-like and TPR domain